jgi:hypothetical protein
MFAEALMASQTCAVSEPGASVCTNAEPFGGPLVTTTELAFVTFPLTQVNTTPGPLPCAAAGTEMSEHVKSNAHDKA